MENLDLCVLWFHYGLHPGHNLRKTAGGDDPAGRLPSFCNESQRAPDDVCFWLCQALDKSSPREDQSACDLVCVGSLKSHLQSRLNCEKLPPARRGIRDCVSDGRAVRARSSWFSCQLNCYLLLFKKTPQGHPQSPQSHRNTLHSLAPTQAGYEGAKNGPNNTVMFDFSIEQGHF